MNTEDLLLQLFARWSEARAQGRRLSAVELCGPNSDLVEPLLLKIEAAEATEVPLATERARARARAAAQELHAVHHDEEAPRDAELRAGSFETRPIDTRLMAAGSRPTPLQAPPTDTVLYDPQTTINASSDDLDNRETQLHYDTELTQLEYVAKGGLGIVYRGSDAELNRHVAVKFIQQRFSADSEHCARLVREAEITGRLDHPGIVAVHGMGRSPTGRLFYVMRYIKGTSFRDRIEKFHNSAAKADEREFEFRSLLKNFVAACETIAYAHNCGILHRDIKPDNIMIGRFGETMIVDWGLAIPIDRALKPTGSIEQTMIPNSSSSTSDSGGGTLPYMSPEQVVGGLLLRPASDVYGLGATLYHLLTGKPAFDGNRYEVLEKVRLGKFTPPRQVKPAIAPGLNAICLKAMSQDPTDRYPLATDLAHDVERWLADLPVSALQESSMARAMRWGRRHRSAMRSGIVGLIAFAALLAGVAMFAMNAARRAEQAHVETLTATAGFAKQTLRNEIQLRWSVLENVVKDPELVELLQQQNAAIDSGSTAIDTPLLAKLNEVVGKHYLANNEKVPANVWSLLSAGGRQVALHSADVKRASPMADFAYRDYFHGLGRNFDPGVKKAPLVKPHVACIFANSKQNKLVTGYSVPIFSPRKPDGSQPVIGVLAMMVDCHQLTSAILGGANVSRSAMTIELRTYPVVAKNDLLKSEGLVIQHPKLTERMIDLDAGTDALRHIDAAALQTMREQPSGVIQLVDPIDGGPAKTAAFARISVADPNAPADGSATGGQRQEWAVVISE